MGKRRSNKVNGSHAFVFNGDVGGDINLRDQQTLFKTLFREIGELYVEIYKLKEKVKKSTGESEF